MARIDPRRAKIHRNYTIAEAAELFGVHRNTVRHWIKAGLPVVRVGRTVLILGRDLGPFLTKRQAARRRKCGPGQFYCFTCREPRPAREGTLRMVSAGGPTANAAALCGSCGTPVHRRVGLKMAAATGFSVPSPEAGPDAPNR